MKIKMTGAAWGPENLLKKPREAGVMQSHVKSLLIERAVNF